MANFNTNQTRHFYVAGANKSASTISDNLDIQLKQATTGEFYFIYKNNDGIIVRSDSIDPKNVTSVKKTANAAMAKKLKMHTVAVDTSAVTLSSLVGKALDITITFHEYVDYDYSSTYTFTASVIGDSTNTANATAFHKALAIAIAKALPHPDPNFPLLKVFSNGSEVTATTAASDVTGASGGVVLVEGVQKYVRGKLTGEACPFTVSFRYHTANEDIVWGTDTVADSNISNNTVVPANYAIADLEYFALGERGDYYRGSFWPNDYTPTYAVNPNSGTYDILTIEYFWAGMAENVQKSPRMVQVAGSTAIINALYSSVDAMIAGTASGSGSGA